MKHNKNIFRNKMLLIRITTLVVLGLISTFIRCSTIHTNYSAIQLLAQQNEDGSGNSLASPNIYQFKLRSKAYFYLSPVKICLLESNYSMNTNGPYVNHIWEVNKNIFNINMLLKGTPFCFFVTFKPVGWLMTTAG